MLSWLSPLWTIGSFDSAVHMSEEAANATKAVPYGILMSIGSDPNSLPIPKQGMQSISYRIAANEFPH